ncbi:type II secretion system F family protein [Streptomyces sp. C11-1]|uniref:Type II secretion system F family protein n=1 Tax=Streptomyces durocortorensis TaxID=2811104 RepID=A0ABY9W6B7_9ACTN|nr:type II secretion system F family protein [Streptomyces durocortorensis]WNF31283.1 type II secretion system F family protein [Streptomyces durocortorensis]
MAAAAFGAAALSGLVWAVGRRERAVRGRGALLLGTAPGARAGWWGRVTASIRTSGGDGPAGGAGGVGVGGGAGRWAAPAGVWLTGWILVGGARGWAVGLAAAYGMWRWQRNRTRQRSGRAHQEQAVIAGQLPLAADLLAACIAVGAGPREAAEAVGESIGGPIGDRLARTAAEIRLGGEPAEAWSRLGEIPGAGSLARCLHRAGSTGAPAAEPVAALARAMRAERADAAVARAQRAGVLITAPVGLCFLPAFLAVGVAPVIIGLAGGLLGAG